MSFNTVKSADIITIDNNYITAFTAILHGRGIDDATIATIVTAEASRIAAQTNAIINTVYDTISSQLINNLKVTLNNIVTNVTLNNDGTLNVTKNNITGVNTII